MGSTSVGVAVRKVIGTSVMGDSDRAATEDRERKDDGPRRHPAQLRRKAAAGAVVGGKDANAPSGSQRGRSYVPTVAERGPPQPSSSSAEASMPRMPR